MEFLSKRLKNESETTVPLKSYRKTLANIFAISAVLLISSQAIRILSVVYLSEDVKMHSLVLPKILCPRDDSQVALSFVPPSVRLYVRRTLKVKIYVIILKLCIYVTSILKKFMWLSEEEKLNFF